MMESTEFKENDLPIILKGLKRSIISVVFEGKIKIGDRVCWSGRVDEYGYNIYIKYNESDNYKRI